MKQRAEEREALRQATVEFEKKWEEDRIKTVEAGIKQMTMQVLARLQHLVFLHTQRVAELYLTSPTTVLGDTAIAPSPVQISMHILPALWVDERSIPK